MAPEPHSPTRPAPESPSTPAPVRHRAIVLVPGWGHQKRHERRDQLAESFTKNDPLPVSPPEPGAIEGETYLRFEPKAADGAAQRPTVDLYEVHWGDMIGAEAEQTPQKRFWNATKLIGYWLFNPWWLGAMRRSKTLTGGLLLSGFLMVVWYFTVVVALATFFVEGRDEAGAASQTAGETAGQAAGGAGPGFSGLFAAVQPAFDPVFDWLAPVASNEVFLAILLLFPLLRINEMAAVATFTRDYLLTGRNKQLDVNIVQRVQDTLERIYARRSAPESDAPLYDEVVVVGHSLGGVIGLEALANWGRPEVKARTALVTWGSPLAVLARRSPERIGARIAEVCGGAIARWIDVHSPNDWLSLPLAEHDRAFPGSTLEGRFSVSWWQAASETAHLQYFHTPEIFTVLLKERLEA